MFVGSDSWVSVFLLKIVPNKTWVAGRCEHVHLEGLMDLGGNEFYVCVY